MSLLISWSIAYDTIIQTVWNFRDADNQKDKDLHLSLFSPQIRREYGGTAANIAYSLALLGKNPHIIATVWEDADEYLFRLREFGISTELTITIPGEYSPQACIIRDQWNGQINTFHPGAMSRSGEITHSNISFTHAIVAPDSKEGMMRRVRECHSQNIFTIFDPGQAMGIFSGDELMEMTTLADITLMNEPERTQFMSITGTDFVEIALKNNRRGIVTLGEKWSIIYSLEHGESHIKAIHADKIIDATGCGDAFRAGLLYGLSSSWDIKKSAMLWSILWGIKIWYMGGQNHTFDSNLINQISEREFGRKFFD